MLPQVNSVCNYMLWVNTPDVLVSQQEEFPPEMYTLKV